MTFPVEIWTDPAGKTITLIGVTHVADAALYAKAQQYVEYRERAGAVVHAEGVQPSTDPMSDAERDLVERLGVAVSSGRALVTALVTALGFSDQKAAGFDPWSNPSWVCTDVTGLQLLRAMRDPVAWVEQHEEVAEVRLEQLPERAQSFVTTAVRFGLRHPVGLRLLSLSLPGKEHAALLDLRNQTAIQAALAEPRDVVEVWGLGHLPGMGRLLCRNGYRRTSRARLAVVATRVARTQRPARAW